jgi:hypothetical protein
MDAGSVRLQRIWGVHYGAVSSRLKQIEQPR